MGDNEYHSSNSYNRDMDNGEDDNMNTQLEVKCKYCNKIFYINKFYLQQAKTTSCIYCKKRFKIN